MKPFFSIIIPVYNVAPYLRECLDSVLNQTFLDWEAICVDDGSTDGSGAILDEYSASDLRFKVVHQKNRGVSAARNIALDNARGTWILFLDGDDVILKDSLKKLKSIISSNPCAQMIAYETFFFGEGSASRCHKEVCDSVSLIDVTKYIRDSKWCRFFAGKAYIREAVSGMRFRPYSRGEDLLFLLACICRVSFVVDSNVVIYGYRQRTTSVVHSNPTEQSIRDQIMASFDIVKTMGQSNKRFPRCVYMTHIYRLLIVHPRNILALRIKEQFLLWFTWIKYIVKMIFLFLGMSVWSF